MKRVLGMLALCAIAVGCGAGGNSVTGTIDGQSLSVKDSVFGQITGPDGSGGSQTVIVVIMSDFANLCTTLKADTQPGNSSILAAGMFSVDPSTGATTTPTAGTYNAGLTAAESSTTGDLATVAFTKYDSSCATTTQDTAASGSVKVDAFSAQDGGSLTGSFDLVFTTKSDHVTGNINAAFCDLPTDVETATPTCS